MAVAKKEIYIQEELDWAETKLLEWRTYVDTNPFDRMKDRIHMKQTKTGTMPMVIASIEQQIKSVRDTMKEYLVLLDQVNKMRQADENKAKEIKGSGNVPTRMK